MIFGNQPRQSNYLVTKDRKTAESVFRRLRELKGKYSANGATHDHPRLERADWAYVQGVELTTRLDLKREENVGAIIWRVDSTDAVDPWGHIKIGWPDFQEQGERTQ